MAASWNGTGQTKKEARQCAIACARSEMRRMGINPKTATLRQFEEVLDDIARTEPGKVGAIWYASAEVDRAEWRRFQSEVRAWQRESY